MTTLALMFLPLLRHPWSSVRLLGMSSLIIGSSLAGCARLERPTLGTVPTNNPVCEALVGPIHYNSSNKRSLRYAGKDLAPDLAVRNRVGENLHCPAYKH